jgi:hypothetical protein
MAKLLTQQELSDLIYSLRTTLRDFDYSSLKNVRFLNLDAFYAYMDAVEGNPFAIQYQALQDHLDKLQPYLPFTSSERASAFLTEIASAKNEDAITQIKKEYTKKLREDFLKLARISKTDSQWQSIIDTCEEIRLRKAESALAVQ